MFVVIGIMLAGILTGYLLRNRKMNWIHKAITFLIWALLFLLGVDVGNDQSIVKGLGSIGVEAVVITAGAVAGSILFAWALWIFVTKRSREREGK